MNEHVNNYFVFNDSVSSIQNTENIIYNKHTDFSNLFKKINTNTVNTPNKEVVIVSDGVNNFGFQNYTNLTVYNIHTIGIGSIKNKFDIEISNIDSTHKRDEIAYVLGEKKYWGKGIGAFAISKIIELAITKYNLNKLIAGLAEGNKGSQRVLEKNGFIIEGCQKNYFFYNGIYYNRLLYGLIL